MSGPCDCGLPALYTACCGRWHLGEAAPSAELLMRSRYSAFVRGNVTYLLATWHPSTRPADIALQANTRWLGLSVNAEQVTGPDHATVTFVARSRVGGGKAQRHQEQSRFIRENGRWFYIDGAIS